MSAMAIVGKEGGELRPPPPTEVASCWKEVDVFCDEEQEVESG